MKALMMKIVKIEIMKKNKKMRMEQKKKIQKI